MSPDKISATWNRFAGPNWEFNQEANFRPQRGQIFIEMMPGSHIRLRLESNHDWKPSFYKHLKPPVP